MPVLINPFGFGPAYPIWNSADKSAAITLSNLDRTAQVSDSSYRGVRSIASKTMGGSEKLYAEFTIDTLASAGDLWIGFALSTYTLGDDPDGSSAVVAMCSDGSIQRGGNIAGGSGGTAAYTAGDVLQVAIDTNNRGLWYGVNNTFIGDPAAGSNDSATFQAGVTVYLLMSTDNAAGDVQVTINAPTIYTPPTGFSASW